MECYLCGEASGMQGGMGVKMEYGVICEDCAGADREGGHAYITSDRRVIRYYTYDKCGRVPYMCYVDRYSPDGFGGVTVLTEPYTVYAKNDRGMRSIAYNRKDISGVQRPDATFLLDKNGEKFSTSNYRVGC